ncbi:MAG: hypothetical protein Q8P53_03905 [Candidatus Shapirobacteria bacterium]|nr:hypothetical protein [Candidatus Shapirobacteria bacterium]
MSKKISTEARLEHRENIKEIAETILSEIHKKGLTSKVYLVNIVRYFKDYPSNKENIFTGYSHIRAEIKSTRYDGIEFFAESPKEVYKKSNGQLSFTGKKENKLFNVYPVGIVPYDWIEYLDSEGDEYGYVPLIYCYFKGRVYWKFWKKLLFFGYPYKKIIYYKLNEIYNERNDPRDMKYSYVYDKIYKK